MIWLHPVRTKPGSFPKWGDMANTTQYRAASLDFGGQLEPQGFSKCRFSPVPAAWHTLQACPCRTTTLPFLPVQFHTHRAAFIGVKLNLRLKGEHACMVMNYVGALHKEKPPGGHGNRPGREAAGTGPRVGGAGWGGGGAPGPAAGTRETPRAGRPRPTAASPARPTRTPPLRFPTK